MHTQARHEYMAPAPLPQSSLLSVADDMVRVFQSLITILSDYYEASLSRHNTFSACTSSLELVQLACADLHQKLAVLWPCQKQYVAVLGCTGCGKSTLLNLLLSMMCPSESTYTQGIRADPVRAVLRDTARVHVGNARSASVGAEVQDEDASKTSGVSPNEADSSIDYVSDDLLAYERDSFEGVLGLCCAQDRPSYMSKHIPLYDSHPFVLQHGRMGDAGTTKVTAVEYGPKFVGHIRWMTRKKMRRKLRDLRQILDSTDSSMQEQLLLELKEFWLSVRQLVNLPSSAERPTEEQINVVIDDLGTKRRLLDKEERIETAVTKGCTVDRVFVREGLKKKLSQQLGKLVEDLRIEVPVASFEGGISLLDVPGTNDPRVLHQRETRDAIDRTSLILLVLDKSVMDNQTQASLAESPLLERMLMDETAGCNLVVVGIAEKNINKGQSPKDLIAGFDSKENVLKSLKKVFQKIASRLCKSKRIQKEHALQRIEDLFTSSITLIPVLPFLCASLHLSPSNPELHRRFCQSEGKVSCPLRMSKDELKERCMETNVPLLLEKVHSVRVPPTKEELSKFMATTVDCLRWLTKQNMVDSSYVEFLETERAQAHKVSSEDMRFEIDINQVVVNMDDALLKFADQCNLELNDINEVCKTGGEDLPSQLQTGRFLLGPFILRGFCPEVIGQNANNLISSIDKESKYFTDQAYCYLCMLRGDEVRLDAAFEKVENDALPLAVGLHDQLLNKWKLSLHRLRAKCFCGGIDGGLLRQVREALWKAYDGALKYLSKELKKQSKTTDFQETLRSVLEGNVLGIHAAKVAKVELGKAFNRFWKNLSQSLNSEIQLQWKSWQANISNLANSAQNSLHIQKKGEMNSHMLDDMNAGDQRFTMRGEMNLHMLDDMKAGDERFRLFQENLKAKEEELEALKRRLDECAIWSQEVFEYGYSLLQSDNAMDLKVNHERQLRIADSPRAGVGRGSLKTSIFEKNSVCLDLQNRFDEPVQGDICGDGIPPGAKENLHGQDNQSSKKDAHRGSIDADISHHKLLGASSSPANVSRLGSFLGRSSRKAQVLSDAEAFKLQKREGNAKRLRK